MTSISEKVKVCLSKFSPKKSQKFTTLLIIAELPYGGHDGDGEEKGVGKCPFVTPALHLFRCALPKQF